MSAATHDAGCRNILPLLPGVRGDALFVGDRGQHRLWLSREWEPDLADPPAREGFILTVGMNPSGAGADRDDLTVRKDQVWTRRWGYRRLMKGNVGTYCATQPGDVPLSEDEACHPLNLATLLGYAEDAALVVVSTGKPPPALVAPAQRFFDALRDRGIRAMCFGRTQDGWPKHSSRLAYATPLEVFTP